MSHKKPQPKPVNRRAKAEAPPKGKPAVTKKRDYDDDENALVASNQADESVDIPEQPKPLREPSPNEKIQLYNAGVLIPPPAEPKE